MLTPTTPKSQLQLCRAADQRVLDVCRTFNEIQTGPNPLTPDDVRKLIDRRPDMYGVLEKWATPKVVSA